MASVAYDRYSMIDTLKNYNFQATVCFPFEVISDQNTAFILLLIIRE